MRAITLLSLRRAAEHHVDRHPVTAKRLADVLKRKVAAHARTKNVVPPPEVGAWIGAIVESMVSSGIVDDRRLAEGRARTLRTRGKSTRMVRESLRQKGVPAELVTEVTEHPTDDDGAETTIAAVDEAAARALVRRRKLGPHRPEEKRGELRQKDLATLARAGFSYALARRVLDDELE